MPGEKPPRQGLAAGLAGAQEGRGNSTHWPRSAPEAQSENLIYDAVLLRFLLLYTRALRARVASTAGCSRFPHPAPPCPAGRLHNAHPEGDRASRAQRGRVSPTAFLKMRVRVTYVMFLFKVHTSLPAGTPKVGPHIPPAVTLCPAPAPSDRSPLVTVAWPTRGFTKVGCTCRGHPHLASCACRGTTRACPAVV